MDGYLKIKDNLILYRGRYKDYIESILEKRPLNEYFEYSERHHVIPFCCGGSNSTEDNILIYLTYREHLIAHKILTEDNPSNSGLAYAYFMMCKSHPESCSLEEYDLGRQRQSEFMKGNKLRKGVKLSPDHKSALLRSHDTAEYHRNLSEGMIGNHNSLGYHDTEETRMKKSEAQKRAHEDDPTLTYRKTKHLKGNKYSLGYKQSDETKRKRSESLKKIASTRRYHLICKSCGKEFVAKGPKKKYCDKCSHICYPENTEPEKTTATRS